jgi:phage shock protein C
MNSRKLYRSRKDKMLGGVAGGLAEYFDVDPTIVRIIFVVTLFLGGGGLIAYIIMWIVVPEEPFVIVPPDTSAGQAAAGETPGPDPQVAYQSRHHRRSSLGGIILLVLGVLFLLDNFIPHFCFGDFWPVILIAIGAGLLMRSQKN